MIIAQEEMEESIHDIGMNRRKREKRKAIISILYYVIIFTVKGGRSHIL